MLDKLRAEALALIAATPHCILATAGPAGIQASMVTCLVREGRIYVLVPSTADHLFNVDQGTEIVVTTGSWQLRGIASIVGNGEQGRVSTAIRADTRAGGLTVIAVAPTRIQLFAVGARLHPATIDFDGASRVPAEAAGGRPG
ncbi:MAG TPA: pyridoxamine 5'-phosphate oxidase family protein [Herpetosiphonaceae bacterium]|nr:pyridoxamine 5'-phosphate oxidase family protein [Herpetosiphonaceae bacterium]